MNNKMKRIFAVGASLMLSVSAFAGCGGGGGDNEEKPVDDSKSQLYVYNFAGGFGTEWLSDLISRYEEANATKSFETGKTGIQVHPTNIKNSVSATNVKNGKESVYFTEHVDLYGDLIVNNAVADITAAITGANPYESGKTLESKMYDDQKSYMSQTINGEKKYYAYPHYLTSFGLVYDIDLFDANGYYFLKNPTVTDENSPLWLDGQFLGTQGGDKSAGPDGVEGTNDDGLPATYEEFFLLCSYIHQSGTTPLLWSGQYRSGYIGHLYNALVTEYEGYEQIRLNYTFDGEATNLGKIVDGAFVEDAESTDITGSNGAELKRQAGKYYALKFVEDLFNQNFVKESDKYGSGTYSHTAAQDDFLMGSYLNTPVAMLADGNWWESEASSTFSQMAGVDSKWSKSNRNLGWMALPKADETKVGDKNVIFDIMYPLSYVKAGLSDWEMNAAIDFLQFANTDESLQKFNEITSTPKAVKYTITNFSNMTAYGKSYYENMKASDIVFPYAANELFMNNQKTFNEIDGSIYNSKAKSATPAIALYDYKVKAADFFSGMYTYAMEQTIWKDVAIR